MPKFWYIARIKYLNEQLQSMPDARIGSHRGKIVVRVGNSSGFKQVGPTSGEFSKFYDIAQLCEELKGEMRSLISEYEKNFMERFDINRLKCIPDFHYAGRMNMAYWEKLIDNECPKEKKNQFPFNGHIFRSKIEREVAQAACELHLSYKYDCGIKFAGDCVYTDLAFAFPEFDRCTLLEVLGRMGDVNYAMHNASKLSNYALNGYMLNRDLFALVGNEHYSPDANTIKRQLVYMVQTICDSLSNSW